MRGDGVELTCPHCGLGGRPKVAPVDGATIRCPRCRGEWVHRAPVVGGPELFEVEPSRPRRGKSRPPWRKPDGSVEEWPTPVKVIAGGVVVGAVAALAKAVGASDVAEGLTTLLGVLVIVGIPLSILGRVGAYIAEQKNRPEREGFLFGFCLGPLGWIIEGLLPTLPSPAPTAAFERKGE